MKLPDKLSDLMELAYNDTLACQEAGHIIHMGYWLKQITDTKCSVCMAGAVMLRQLNPAFPFGGELMPSDFKENYLELATINNVRTGNFEMVHDPEKIHLLERRYEELTIDARILDEDWPEMIAYMRELGL